MRKLFIIICMLAVLSGFTIAYGQGNVRVKCRQFAMNTPSANVHCYQTDQNISVPIDALPEELEKAQIANTAIYFTDFELINNDIAPQVTFYTIEDLGRTSFSLLDPVMTLTDLNNNIKTGDLSVDSVLDSIPFLPYQAKQKTISALPAFLECDGGSGIRSITAFDQTLSASGSRSNIYYSWQGLSDDGVYYISAVFPLRSASLDGRSISDVDWNSLNSSDFQPSIEQLDYYVRSIVIE